MLIPEDICNLAQLRKGNFMIEPISISFYTLQTQRFTFDHFRWQNMTYRFSEQFQLI
jgi:hypothetical protein